MPTVRWPDKARVVPASGIAHSGARLAARLPPTAWAGWLCWGAPPGAGGQFDTTSYLVLLNLPFQNLLAFPPSAAA